MHARTSNPCRLTSTLAEYVSVRVFHFITTPIVHFSIADSPGVGSFCIEGASCASMGNYNITTAAEPFHFREHSATFTFRKVSLSLMLVDS